MKDIRHRALPASRAAARGRTDGGAAYPAGVVAAEVMDGVVVPRCIIVPSGPATRAAAAAAAPDLGREGIEVVVVDVDSAVQALPAPAVLAGAE